MIAAVNPDILRALTVFVVFVAVVIIYFWTVEPPDNWNSPLRPS